MTLQSGEIVKPPSTPTQIGKSGTRLRGPRLRVARAAWVATVLLSAILFLIALPVRQVELLRTYQNLSPSQELILRDLGASGEQHAAVVLFVEAIIPVIFLAVAVLVFWHRSDDWVAMLVSAGLVTYSMWTSPPLDSLAALDPAWRIPSTIVQALGMACTMAFFYVFPDGKLVPRWTGFLLGAWAFFAAAWALVPGSIFDLSYTFRLSLPSFGLLMAWLGTGYVAQIYRYVRVATPIQRQQTKLILFATSVAILGYLTFGFNRFAVPVMAQPVFAGIVYDLIGVPIFLMITLVIPVAFAVSILRYRLWDVDVVINRAIVYGVLTAVLAGLYTTSITLSQRLFVALTGERSDAAIVLTTLVVASSFTPVKANLQNVVDRYLKPMPDPRKEVQALSAQIRAFVEMIDVQELARKVCDEAVRAFDASGGAVYLLQHGHFRLLHTKGEWNQVEGVSVWLEAEGRRYGWIALGPRRNQAAYEEADRKLFAEMGMLAARTMWVVERVSNGDSKPAVGQAESVGR